MSFWLKQQLLRTEFEILLISETQCCRWFFKLGLRYYRFWLDQITPLKQNITQNAQRNSLLKFFWGTLSLDIWLMLVQHEIRTQYFFKRLCRSKLCRCILIMQFWLFDLKLADLQFILCLKFSKDKFTPDTFAGINRMQFS